jgi:hypothetical protein
MPQAIHTRKSIRTSLLGTFVLFARRYLHSISFSLGRYLHSISFSLGRYPLLTMQTTRGKPMINIAKVSDWLTRNANEKLYPRLL